MLDESFIGSVISSVFAVISSEIGDKTFFVAVLLSTAATDGPSKTGVFLGALIANAALHSAAVLLGSVSSVVIPRAFVCWSSTFLVGFYGMKMLRDGFNMSPDKTQREYEEAEHEVKELKKSEENPGGNGLVEYLSSSYFVKSFCLTFASEWGDRSQISALLMTTAGEASAVLFGGILGHVLCLLVAVVGGSYVGHLVSVRVMTICGGFLFLFLALSLAYDIYAGDGK